MEHLTVKENGGEFHVAMMGQGQPLLLLHGWPEFWLTWEPVMQRLSDRYRLFAPDLRGFGDSSKPAGPWGAADHAGDMVAVMDALGLQTFGVVGHDVGGAIMQSMARVAPERFTRLFFFDFVYPGIGTRMGTSDRLNEIWYQSFHQMEMAPALLSSSREACKLYISHILHHWTYQKDAFDGVFEDFIDNFMKPGNLAGGFAYYQAAHVGRMAIIRGEAPRLSPITTPTCVRWAEHDPIFPFAWTDRLGETFANFDLKMLPGVGHFPHREDPDLAAREIAGFFGRIGEK
jgi:pimeloyl-ACP methyl ester carboxylesterase